MSYLLFLETRQVAILIVPKMANSTAITSSTTITNGHHQSKLTMIRRNSREEIKQVIKPAIPGHFQEIAPIVKNKAPRNPKIRHPKYRI